jgi:putative transposase
LKVKEKAVVPGAGIKPSVGSVGDPYDNVLAEIIIGLFKIEVVELSGS